jgi:endoglucanase Acf2
MMKHFVRLLTASLGLSWASAQSVVPVGAGSYQSYPPPQANAGTTPQSPSSYLVATNGQPIPSNKWWTDLINRPYAGNLWAYPLTVSADSQGISIYNPVNWVTSRTS